MATPFVGEIIIFGGSFAPAGWMFCEGQLLQIAEYDTLFNLIGTTYGGDGQNTFQLPDLRGRLPIHMGTLAGGGTYVIGQSSGTESVTLTTPQLPAHSHALTGTATVQTRGDAAGNLASPDGAYVATAPLKKYFNPTATAGKMAALSTAGSLAPAGGSQPHSNMQPFLVLNYIISLFGVYPTQN